VASCDTADPQHKSDQTRNDRNEETVLQYLLDVLREVAYMDFEPDQPLVVDSLVAAEIKWRVDLDHDVELPLEEFLRGLTVRELAVLIETAETPGVQLEVGRA
jgi:acyl carrier protein